MDDATRQKMFEPFFTTKGEAGFGLGLLNVQQAVARSGGRIEVTSKVGEGTRIRLLLPRIAGPGQAGASCAPVAAATQSSPHRGAMQ